MEDKDLKKELAPIEKYVTGLVINNPESYQQSIELRAQIDVYEKKCHNLLDDPISNANKLHKSLTGKLRELLDPSSKCKKIIQEKSSAYLTRIEMARREEQARLNLEREERERKEREKLEKAAIKAEEKGQTEKAESLRERAEEVNVPLSIVEPEIKKSVQTDAGTITQKTDISVTITDPMKIIQAIVSGRIPISVITINEFKLKQVIKLNCINNLDGCVISQIVNTSFRSK
jgi:DNA-binding protein H-NS